MTLRHNVALDCAINGSFNSESLMDECRDRYFRESLESIDEQIATLQAEREVLASAMEESS